jgi:DNA-binding NarL/FixJ family response regulator
MKKIRITLVIAGKEDYPGCGDIVETCTEFQIVARHGSLTAPGIWQDLTGSDIILLDELAVSQDGRDAVRTIHESFPYVKILLIMQKTSKNKTMEALSMGITGVMERACMLASVRKAIPVLYSGETWVSRGLVKSLHSQLKYAGDDSLFPHLPPQSGFIKN